MMQRRRRFKPNERVLHEGMTWRICRDGAEPDGKKHLLYKIFRGAWRKHVRGDLLCPLG